MADADQAGIARDGLALAYRYQESGELTVLQDAIGLLRRSVDVPVPSATWLINLCAALQQLYMRTGDLAVLGEAVDIGRRAVAAAPGDPIPLSNLASALEMLFQAGGDRQNLDLAVTWLPWPSRHGWLTRRHRIATSERTVTTTNLSDAAHATLSRYQVSGDTADLNTAIGYCLSALKAIPLESHPTSKPALQTTMGDALLSLASTMSGQPREQLMREHGRAALSAVTQSPAATTSQRIHAWRSLGRSALATNETDAALTAYTEAVQLLPSLASRRWAQSDDQGVRHRPAGAALAVYREH